MYRKLLLACAAGAAFALACGPMDGEGVVDGDPAAPEEAGADGAGTKDGPAPTVPIAQPGEQPAPVPAPPVEPTEPGQPAQPQPPATPLDPLAALPTCTGSVLDAFSLSTIQPPTSGSDAYQVPSVARRAALESSIKSLLAGDAETALTAATTAEYTLCRGATNEASLVLWRPPSGEGHAPFALRTGAARPVILEAPHPVYDSGTLEESVYLFDRLKARALIASGTHRCASNELSGCSGTTSACGGGPFRASDMAHTEDSAYHTAHRVLSEHFAQDWVIGVHGMSASGASVSDGTDHPTTADSPSAKVTAALAARFSDVVTCNAYPGAANVDTHLCGTTDVQGRHLNGAAPACSTAASGASGRFIHLEQSKAMRQSHGLVGDALDSVVPAAL